MSRTTEQQNNRTTEQQNNRTTEQQNNRTTEQQNNRTKASLILVVCFVKRIFIATKNYFIYAIKCWQKITSQCFFVDCKNITEKIIQNSCKNFYLILFAFLFSITSLFADFDITKKIKPIKLSDFSNVSCDDLYVSVSPAFSFTMLKLCASKGLATIFKYEENIYITYISDNNTLQIKKIDKNGTLEDFISIPNCNFLVETNTTSTIPCVRGSAVLAGEYICFFHSQAQTNKLVITRVSLKTKEIEQRVDSYTCDIFDAIFYDGWVYVLAYNGSKQVIIKFNPREYSITNIIDLPVGIWWNTLAFQVYKMNVYGLIPYSVNDKSIINGFNFNFVCQVDIDSNTVSLSWCPNPLVYVKKDLNNIYSQMPANTSGEDGYTRSFKYNDDSGDKFCYVIRSDQGNAQAGYAVYKNREQARDFNCNMKQTYCENLYADNSGLYISYTDLAVPNKVGFLKKSIDGSTDLAPNNSFYIDNENITRFDQNNAMMVAKINGKKQMLMIASGYYNNEPRTMLYFMPAEDGINAFYVDETESVISPSSYPNNYGSYNFKFEYVSFKNERPINDPTLYIYNKGELVKSCIMEPDYNDNDTNYTDGKIYSYNTDIGPITATDNYTYRIKIGENYSKEYAGPFYYGEEPTFTITDYEGTYILPKGKINPNKEVSIQMTYSYTGGENGELASEYPKVFIYNKNDLVNPIGTYTMSYIAGSSNGYRANIGTFFVGEYKYKIIAKNKSGLEKEVSGTFSCSVKESIIAEYEGAYIKPKGNIIKPNTQIKFQMRYTGDEGIPLESGYPRVDIYRETDLSNPIGTYTMTKILDSTNGYSVNIGAFSVGKYKYKITAKNEFVEKSVDGTFTIGELTSKCYNAPNPFNPQAGERTKIFFEMPESGSVEIDIYSEYGDKIYHTSIDGLSKGINSIEYAGRDDRGDILYNGTYVCVVKKKYLGTTKKEKCRLLVIK